MAVYFITARDLDLVKIGYSSNPAGRLGKFSADCPVPIELEAVIAGGRDVEAQMHERFAAERTRGEWFTITPDIEAVMAANKYQPKPRKLTPEQVLRQKLLRHVKPAYASMLVNGKRTPSLRLALELERLEGIPVAFWQLRDSEAA